MNKSKITVGIPAFNEATNIKFVINDVLKQVQKTFTVSKILVVSDGSTDKTVEIVKKIKSSKIQILDDKLRLGLGARQNQIFKLSNTEILVLIQADVALKDKFFLEKLVNPIIYEGADLTAASLQAVDAQTFVEKVLSSSMRMKKRIFESFNFGNNVYTCHGPARALSKKLYKTIKFKTSIGEDGYSYLFCQANGFQYKYINDAKVFYKLPDNLHDHLSQSLRYESSKKIFESEFGGDIVKKSYSIPPFIIAVQAVKAFLQNPVYLICYLGILLYANIKFYLGPDVKERWEISLSSKKLKGRII